MVNTRLVDCETQTEAMDISETDVTPSPSQDNKLFVDRGEYIAKYNKLLYLSTELS